MSKPAVFLDRDGVLNALVWDAQKNEFESPRTAAQLRLLPGVAEAAKRLQDAGFLLFIVSNQPNYAKGKTSLADQEAVARQVEAALRGAGVTLARAYYCTHHPQAMVAELAGECACRKPKPGLLFKARDEFDLDLAQSWFIGDSESDVDCGQRAGCRTLLVLNHDSAARRPGAFRPTLTALNLPDAVSKLLAIDDCGLRIEGSIYQSPISNPQSPIALVLAAGLSTRLAALTGGLPKPLTPVAGVPVLHRNLRWLAAHGIQDVFINLHYRGEEIKASVGDGRAFGLRVTWSEEQPILGTAGAAKKLARELGAHGGPFLVVYGDNLFDFNLTRMLDAHLMRQTSLPPLFKGGRTAAGGIGRAVVLPPLKRVGRGGKNISFTSSMATIAVFDPDKNVHTGIAGGRVLADETGRITGFKEGNTSEPLPNPSPKRGEASSPSLLGKGLGVRYVNAACYILDAGVLNFVPEPPRASDWMRDVFPAMLQAGKLLRAYPIEGYCLGIDTPQAYQCAEQLLAKNSEPRA